MTDPMASTPGWVDTALDRIFAALGPETGPARDAFATCLAAQKAPAAPSDMLGAEFESCHAALRRNLLHAGVSRAMVESALSEAEALEAEIAADS